MTLPPLLPVGVGLAFAFMAIAQSAAIIAVLSICIWRGQRWAMIVTMALWGVFGINLLYIIYFIALAQQRLITVSIGIILIAGFWSIIFRIFYRPFRVEQERRAIKRFYAIPHLDRLARVFVRTRRAFASQPSRGHGMTGKALKSPVVDQICYSAPGRREVVLGSPITEPRYAVHELRAARSDIGTCALTLRCASARSWNQGRPPGRLLALPSAFARAALAARNLRVSNPMKVRHAMATKPIGGSPLDALG